MTMLGAVLVVLGLVAMPPQQPQAGAASPEALIARLGAPKYADREAAAGELERLGRAALPALLARREHRDLEVRSRVNALVARIEGSLLLESTPVVLDYDDRPVGEVVAAIAKRSDIPLALGPGAPTSRRVTLRDTRPVPFWTAVDRLAESADLGYALASAPVADARERHLSLGPMIARPPGMMSDHGPFRVNLMSLHYQRDLSFLPPPSTSPRFRDMAAAPPVPTVTTADGRLLHEQFYLRLQAAAEPRLSLRQAGPLKLSAAVDDLGQSLIPAAAAEPGPGVPRMMTTFGPTSAGPLQFQVGLRRPDSPGRTIRLLRGSIPASVATRRPDALVIPVAGAAGKSFRNEDATVVLHDIRPAAPGAGAGVAPGGPTIVELSITPEASRAAAAPEPAPDLDTFLPRTDYGPLQIELIDAEGRPVHWYISASQQNGDETRLTLTTTGATPAVLRHYGVIRANTEIPFEFRDVPMP